MGHKPRSRPQHLAAKLLAIRGRLGMSQSQIGRALGFKKSFGRIAEYEKGGREPDLFVLLRYARLAKVTVESLIDDTLDLPF